MLQRLGRVLLAQSVSAGVRMLRGGAVTLACSLMMIGSAGVCFLRHNGLLILMDTVGMFQILSGSFVPAQVGLFSSVLRRRTVGMLGQLMQFSGFLT